MNEKRKILQMEQIIERLKSEKNRRPLRIEPPGPMSSYDEVHNAYCAEDAPDSPGEWDSGINYNKNDFCLSGEYFYRSKQDGNVNHEPPETENEWWVRDDYAQAAIKCYLDEDETGEEIVVYCILVAADIIKYTFPQLKTHYKLQAVQMNEEWWCISDIFIGYVSCYNTSPEL